MTTAMAGQVTAQDDETSLLLQLPAILAGHNPAPPVNPPVIPPPSNGEGHITFTRELAADEHYEVYRIAANEGAVPENISTALDALYPVSTPFDRGLNSSPNGEWLIFETTRFNSDCADWPCLALVKSDLSSGYALEIPSVPDDPLVHAEGWSAVSSGGDLVVYPALDNFGRLDLWATTQSGNGKWSAPINLTIDSTYSNNRQPSLSSDGSKIVFRCGSEPDGSGSICEVNSNGTGFRIAVTAEQIGSTFLNQPDYAPDGSIVFEDAGGLEQIWRLPAGTTSPVKIINKFTNDNSPCVLPDGRIVSLWIRTDPHEMKVMHADGSSHFMLMEGVDVKDIGLGCSY